LGTIYDCGISLHHIATTTQDLITFPGRRTPRTKFGPITTTPCHSSVNNDLPQEARPSVDESSKKGKPSVCSVSQPAWRNTALDFRWPIIVPAAVRKTIHRETTACHNTAVRTPFFCLKFSENPSSGIQAAASQPTIRGQTAGVLFDVIDVFEMI